MLRVALAVLAVTGALLVPACFVSIPDYHATRLSEDAAVPLADAGADASGAPGDAALVAPEIGRSCGTKADRACASSAPTQLLVCSGTLKWDANGTCGGATPSCVDGRCVACGPGETGCDGETPLGCGADGQWARGAVCAGGTPLCSGGVCVAHCTSGERSCSGDTPRQCTDGAWVDGTACAAPAPTCVAGACTGSCVGADVACSGNALLACVSGNWKPGATCDGKSPVCIEGHCAACVPTSFGCDRDVVRQCSSDETWVVSRICSDPEPGCYEGECSECGETNRTRCTDAKPACFRGKCVECDPGARICHGANPSLCNDRGVWRDAKACTRDCVAATGLCGTCSDGLQSGDETGEDCGGASCGPCADGVTCILGIDCRSGVCAAGRCQAPTCGDVAKNGRETDVDCGGASACRRCLKNEHCVDASDCESGSCNSGVCGSAFPYPPSNVDPDDAEVVAAANPLPSLIFDCGESIFHGGDGTFTNACHGAVSVAVRRKQIGGPAVNVIAVRHLTVAEGATLVVTGVVPVVFVVYGDVSIAGTIALGHDAANPLLCNAPEESGGGAFGEAGGNSVAFQGLGGRTYYGGSPSGNPELVPMRGGCPGRGMIGDFGGGGGNGIQISSRGTLTVLSTAVVAAPGGGGIDTTGGGSGGGILLEGGGGVSIAAGAWLTANGGGGGSREQGAPGSSAGADGDPASATPAAGNAAAFPAGNGGTVTSPATEGHAPPLSFAENSGGGGGVGRIRVNSPGQCTLEGNFSPLASTGCTP